MLVVSANEQLPVAAARAGDPDAWDVLFRRYQLPLYVYAVEMVHNDSTARDVVQETFITALRHIEGLRDDGRFGSWLFSIAHQRCIQTWRKSERERILAEEELEEPGEFEDSPSDFMVRKEQEEAFMSLIAQLPVPQRAVLLLHFVEEFPLDEIAQITGTNAGTVKSRLHYAKKALRKLVSRINR